MRQCVAVVAWYKLRIGCCARCEIGHHQIIVAIAAGVVATESGGGVGQSIVVAHPAVTGIANHNEMPERWAIGTNSVDFLNVLGADDYGARVCFLNAILDVFCSQQIGAGHRHDPRFYAADDHLIPLRDSRQNNNRKFALVDSLVTQRRRDPCRALL